MPVTLRDHFRDTVTSERPVRLPLRRVAAPTHKSSPQVGPQPVDAGVSLEFATSLAAASAPDTQLEGVSRCKRAPPLVKQARWDRRPTYSLTTSRSEVFSSSERSVRTAKFPLPAGAVHVHVRAKHVRALASKKNKNLFLNRSKRSNHRGASTSLRQ